MLYRVWFLRVCLFLCAGFLLLPGLAAGAENTLVVAWTDDGDLYTWQEGQEKPLQVGSGYASKPVVAPDGEYIAFIQIEDDLSQSVNVVGSDGQGEKELVSGTQFPSIEDGSPVIGQVAWQDASTIYFSTAQLYDTGYIPQEDLWRVDAETGSLTQVLAAGEGGVFTFSPDATWMTVIGAGRYDGADGQVRLMDVSGQNQVNVLPFSAVSTGSEYNYYAPVFWDVDSQALRVALPERDLIYADSSGNTTLWQLGVDGSQTQLGTVQASFFGPPKWSADRLQLAYMRRAGGDESNQFDLIIAGGDGGQPQVYASGESGSIRFTNWLPDGSQFLFEQGQPGDYWIGEAGQEALHLGSDMVQPEFVSSEIYVYFHTEADKLELRYAHRDADSVLIATMKDSDAWFDAVITR